MLTQLSLRNFRSYDRFEFKLSSGLTVLHGQNGVGKTNCLEGIYFACTGRTLLTNNERDLIRFEENTARAEVQFASESGLHLLAAAIDRQEGKQITFNGQRLEGRLSLSERPPIAVFIPQRLDLVTGTPAVRRGHFDGLISALWPARKGIKSGFRQTLIQRNALLSKLSFNSVSTSQLAVWDQRFVLQSIELMQVRSKVTELLNLTLTVIAQRLGLAGDIAVRYRSSAPSDAHRFLKELQARRSQDIERRFSTFGPHRDEFLFLRDERPLKSFGSQGEKRLFLLALLAAERELLLQFQAQLPVFLLDDVMSELDASRRELLVTLLSKGGQSVITTTELESVPIGSFNGEVKTQEIITQLYEGSSQ